MCHKKLKNTTSLPTVKDCPSKYLPVHRSHRNNNTEKSNTEKKNINSNTEIITQK